MDDILDDHLLEKDISRRRDLLPLWIKIFTWIFLVLGPLVIAAAILTLLGRPTSFMLYGLNAWVLFSLEGILLVLLYQLKAVVAFGLWFEKDWAVRWAEVDGFIGIFICLFFLLVLPFIGGGVRLRVELLFLIPYTLRMKEIRETWRERG